MNLKISTSLVLSLLISSNAFADSSFVIAKSQIEAGDFQVSSASLKSIGLAVLEKCENLSADDKMEIVDLAGAPGKSDFQASIYRKSRNGSGSEMVQVTAAQNLDAPFNIEYQIDCLGRAQALQDQSSIETSAQILGQGSVRDLVIKSAKLGNVIVTTEESSSEVEFQEVQSVLVSYNQVGRDGQVGLYEHTQALPMNKMSKAFVQKVMASNGQLNAHDLVRVSQSTKTVKSKTNVCVESKQVATPPSVDEPNGSVETICSKYKEVETKTTYDVIGLVAKL